MAYRPHEEPFDYLMPPPSPPRISGTAMPDGVFLSSGVASTASALRLAITGFTIVSIGFLSLVPSYVVIWTLDQYLRQWHLALPAVLLQVGGPADAAAWAVARAIINVISFFVFLGVLRLTSLAGYHAAEHMTVHAIERYGVYGWEPYVVQMPRAHRRCGSNLLAGALPALLVGLPVFTVSPLLGLLIALLGWSARHRLGYFLQNTFTTKPPTQVQLRRGIEAGRELLAKTPYGTAKPLPLAQRLWRRGMPQIVAGVVAAMYVFGAIADRLHWWLDW